MIDEGRIAFDWLIPEGKTWVDLFQALLTPTIALLGATIAILQYRLSSRKRNDDLFEKRWIFFDDCWAQYRNRLGAPPSTLKLVQSRGNSHVREYEDGFSWEPYAQKAEFLFGPRVAQEVRKFHFIREDDPELSGWDATDALRNAPAPAWFVDIFREKLDISR